MEKLLDCYKTKVLSSSKQSTILRLSMQDAIVLKSLVGHHIVGPDSGPRASTGRMFGALDSSTAIPDISEGYHLFHSAPTRDGSPCLQGINTYAPVDDVMEPPTPKPKSLPPVWRSAHGDVLIRDMHSDHLKHAINQMDNKERFNKRAAYAALVVELLRRGEDV